MALGYARLRVNNGAWTARAAPALNSLPVSHCGRGSGGAGASDQKEKEGITSTVFPFDAVKALRRVSRADHSSEANGDRAQAAPDIPRGGLYQNRSRTSRCDV